MSSYENQEELYSRPVRAGKRTYFFDVKATRGKDLYMTITESKRRFDDHGNVSYSKHKIFPGWEKAEAEVGVWLRRWRRDNDPSEQRACGTAMRASLRSERHVRSRVAAFFEFG